MALMSNPQSFLGLDLGAGSIKLVELKNEKGRPRLVTFGSYEVPFAQSEDNDWSKRKDEAATIVKMLVEQTQATSNLVVTAMPTFAVFSSLITVPDVSQKDMANAIRVEAKKVVPRPLEEMNLVWQDIEKTEIKSKPMAKELEEDDAGDLGTITGAKGLQQKKMLITAAPKDLVNSYIEIIKNSGLKLVSLETEALALSRSLIGKDPSVVMVVDIGAKTTNLSIIDRGIPVVNRGVNFGGSRITQQMSGRMSIDIEKAEQWKRDMGRDFREKQLSPATKEILDDVLHEITYLFQLYRSQFVTEGVPVVRIEKIVLTGGAALIPGFASYLANDLNVPVHLGDPWARIVYPEDLQPMLDQIGPSMAVAVGLAMRHIVS